MSSKNAVSPLKNTVYAKKQPLFNATILVTV